MVGVKVAGGAEICSDVIFAALAKNNVERLYVYGSPQNEYIRKSDEKRVTWNMRSLEDRNAIKRTNWLLYGFSKAAADKKVDVGICMANGGMGNGKFPVCVYVHQSLPFSNEALSLYDVSMQFRLSIIKQIMALSCRSAEMVAVQTKVMAQCLIKEFGLAPDKLRVFTPSSPRFPENKVGASEYVDGAFIYVGSDAPHKNLKTLETAYRLARERNNEIKMAWITLPGSSPPRDSRIYFLSGRNRAEIAASYKAARALVMPSLVETVGLPMLEAMKIGCPVVAADRPYAHEICGDAAVYFDPNDPEDIAQALVRLDRDKDIRKELIEKGRAREAAFSAAKPYERLVEEVVKLAESRTSR